jgi:hypothetical protein
LQRAFSDVQQFWANPPLFLTAMVKFVVQLVGL